MKVLLTILTLSFTLMAICFSSLSHAQEIKVMTYNVWGLPFPIAKRIKRLKIIKKVLHQYNADIIGLQEAFTKKARKIIKQNEYPYTAKGPKGGKFKLCSGLALLSKYPIIKTKTMTFQDCSGFDCYANKGVLFARINLGNQTIDTYLTHLNADGEDHQVRFKQVIEVIKFVNENSFGEKVIFLGDFNFTDRSILHSLLKTKLGLYDSFQEYIDDNPDLPSDIQRGITNKNNKRIDYIWTSPEFSTFKSEVVLKEKLYKNKQLSDHRALLSTFEF